MTDERSEREQESATNFTKIQREVVEYAAQDLGMYDDYMGSDVKQHSEQAIQAYHQALIDEGMLITDEKVKKTDWQKMVELLKRVDACNDIDMGEHYEIPLDEWEDVLLQANVCRAMLQSNEGDDNG